MGKIKIEIENNSPSVISWSRNWLEGMAKDFGIRSRMEYKNQQGKEEVEIWT